MFFEFAFTDPSMGIGVISDLSGITQMQRLVYFWVLEFICLFGLIASYFVLKWGGLLTLRHYTLEKPLRALQLGGACLGITGN